MKLYAKILAVLFIISTFVILNDVTIPYLDTLDKDSVTDILKGVLLLLGHVLIPSGILYIVIIKDFIDKE
jgi:hypothetical protein